MITLEVQQGAILVSCHRRYYSHRRWGNQRRDQSTRFPNHEYTKRECKNIENIRYIGSFSETMNINSTSEKESTGCLYNVI